LREAGDGWDGKHRRRNGDGGGYATNDREKIASEPASPSSSGEPPGIAYRLVVLDHLPSKILRPSHEAGSAEVD
jgi:hypothetical protein